MKRILILLAVLALGLSAALAETVPVVTATPASAHAAPSNS